MAKTLKLKKKKGSESEKKISETERNLIWMQKKIRFESGNIKSATEKKDLNYEIIYRC